MDNLLNKNISLSRSSAFVIRKGEWQERRLDSNNAHSSVNSQELTERQLAKVLPTEKTDSEIRKARLIMGDTVDSLSDEDLQAYLTEFKQLVGIWLDGYEKNLFDGKTLKQLLQEG